MSKYTMQLRYVCEQAIGKQESGGFGDIEQTIREAAPLIFDFPYPIFDESYRRPLEKKILRHYFLREIGQETVGEFKYRLSVKMNEIMPLINQYYRSELLSFNPLQDTDITTDHTKNFDETNNGNSNKRANEIGERNRSRNVDDVFSGEKVTANDTVEEETGSRTETTDAVDNTTTNGTTQKNFTSEGTEVKHEDGKNFNWNLYSDTPQGSVKIFGSDVVTGTYDANIQHGEIYNPNNDRVIDTVAGESYLTDARRTIDHSVKDGRITTNNSGNETTTAQGTEIKNSDIEKVESNNRENTTTENGRITDSTRRDTDETETENRQQNNTESITTSATINNTEDYIEHIRGKRGVQSYSQLLMQFRESFLNVDKMVLDELNVLFFGLW